MSLADLIRKRNAGNLATAIPAISATQQGESAATVARIATVAVASPTSSKPFDREAFGERGAIREFDGGFSRHDAEQLARADLADDRIHCTDCAHLRGRICAQAAMLGVRQGYMPVLTIARRCECFKPMATALDRRNGTERWPSLLADVTVH